MSEVEVDQTIELPNSYPYEYDHVFDILHTFGQTKSLESAKAHRIVLDKHVSKYQHIHPIGPTFFLIGKPEFIVFDSNTYMQPPTLIVLNNSYS
jgi:hypothetical protein